MFGQSTFGQQLYVSTIVTYYLLSLLLTDYPTTYMYALLLFIWKDVYIIIFHTLPCKGLILFTKIFPYSFQGLFLFQNLLLLHADTFWL